MATPGMSLVLPVPGVTQALGIAAPGQSYGELVNSAFGVVDLHTHAPGSGVPVPTSGIAINADLTFGGFNATNLRTTQFSGIALGALGVNDRNCLLASSGDLYFVDGSGNQVRMTASGSVAGTPGAITGLASPAAVTYTVGSKLFTFTSSTPRVAGIACGPLSIGDASVDNGKQVTISAPAGLVANYAMKLPTALPGAQNMVTLDNTGALSTFGATFAGSDLTLPGKISGPGFGSALTNTGSTPVAATLLNSWTSISGSPVQTAKYWKDACGIVHLMGNVQSGGVAQTVFNLPAGFRPAALRLFNVLKNDTTAVEMGITTAGDVQLGAFTVGQTATLDGISFLAEQ